MRIGDAFGPPPSPDDEVPPEGTAEAPQAEQAPAEAAAPPADAASAGSPDEAPADAASADEAT